MFLVPGFSFLGSDGRTLGRMAPLRKYTRIGNLIYCGSTPKSSL